MAESYSVLDELGYANSDSQFARTLRRFDIDRRSDFNSPMRKGMGYVFITRPWLNLSYNNMASYRRLMNLYDDNLNSIASWARLTLDPRQGLSRTNRDTTLLDVYNPWIPLLTNTMATCSGWPDKSLDFKTSDPGRLKEVSTIVTGTSRQYESFPLNMEFRNLIGSPLGLMFSGWLDYMGEAHSEDVVPYEDALVKNYKDYDVGIWRIVLDSTSRRVTDIAWTIGFPVVDANGADLNFDRSKPFQEDNQDYNVTFQCDTLYHNDPILPSLFNTVSGALDPNFAASSDPSYLGGVDRSYYVKITTMAERNLFMDLRPWINTETMELEYYVRKSEYNRVYGV